ncbi:MAG: glycosyltransferase family 4 protein [Gemmatimonas sp.]
MSVAFVVRDELVPVRNGYHSTGTNLLRQLVRHIPVRCVHLGATVQPAGPTAAWCAEHGIGYDAVGIAALPALDGSSGVLRTLQAGRDAALRNTVTNALQSIRLGANDERVVMFTTGWDAIADVVASAAAHAVCFPADSITLFEERRLLEGVKRLLRPARVFMAGSREKKMLGAGYSRVVYVTENDATAARALSANPRQVVTVPIGINPEDFASVPTMAERLHAHGERIVFTGTLAYLPNRDAATRIATQILPRLHRESVTVRLVGSGGEALASLAGPRLHIAGWAPSLIDELAQAALFVAPVRMGAGAKNNVLQALAAGTPVIGTASCFAGFKTLPPGGIVCESDDDFVQAIERTLADRNTLEALSASARQFALSQCTWSVSAERLEHALEITR